MDAFGEELRKVQMLKELQPRIESYFAAHRLVSCDVRSEDMYVIYVELSAAYCRF